ncbi:titin-like [Myxocyprinus asiaticus]|uniref:titin-like n=1 Tax=Myxocyprinus asiaticus TaxID=70543 RepID=UPI0022220960|nr:titin-like [Myxocyprinus asiaticus]
MFQIILLTVAVQVASQVSESTDETTIMSKPKITRSPAHTVLYSADNVTLKCEVTDAPSGVEYDWYKDSTQLGSHTDKLTITEPGDGSYQCKAKVGIFQSDKSDPHTLTVQTIPTAKTTLVSKWAEVYQSEKVNLKCEIQGRSEAWIYKWYRNGVSLQESNSQLEIQSATMDNSGNYTCQGFLQNRLNAEHSNALTLKVNERPVPQVQSDWTEAFPGETVSLQCVIQGVSENWIYMWFRDKEKIGSSNHENRAGNNLSLSVNPSHDGAYKCQAELQGRSVKTHISPQFQLKVYGAQPTVLLNQDPTFPLIYTQEQVKLICSIQEQTSNWEYLWYKVPDEVNSIFSDAIYTISSATLSHNGIYTCHVRRRGKQYPSTKSHNLTIREPPQPNLSIESQWKTFYENEKVTLKCSINGISNEWSYEWFRNGTNVSKDKDISLFGTILSISSAKTSHSGWYTCRVKHAKRLPVTTREAEALRLQIYDKTPNPKTGKHPSFEFFYTEEQVQLDCNMPGDGWEYHWYEGSKPTEPLSTDPTYNISSASFSHTFYCTAKRGDFSVRSENIEVIVKERPVPQVRSDWTEAFPGETVSLQCVIQGVSENWIYMWFRDMEKIGSSDHENRAGNNLSLSVNPSHDGAYKCQAELQGRSVKTDISPQFQLKVYGAQPTVLLNQDPTFPLIYTQEQVKLICSIQEQTSNWEYLWYKVPDEVNSIFSDAIYTISSATLSHNGIYTCHVRRRGKQYPSTKSHNLTIGEPPQPNLSIESQWKTFYGNEKVTLKCSINGISNEWSYEWFRNGTNVSKDKDISLFGTILSISSAKTSHSGWYTCRGKHAKRLPVTTREAEALRLQIYDKTPNPKTGKHPSFEFFYTEEQVQHDCNMPGDGWEYHWYEGSKPTEPLSTDPTYNISSASFSHTFYCTAKRGDFSVRSENIEVIVKARPPAVLTLETEWGDIMAGNILTLKCEITDEREWNYTWYENGLKLNGSLDIYKVTATEETIKSEFKCKGIRTERPLYSAMSEGFIVNNTVFKRKILLAISGCLICCIVILIIGCVILKFTRKSAKKETYRITEDLFFSMADSNQTAAPLKEYMDNKPTDSEMKECDEKELLSDCISAVHVDGVIKDEDSPSTEANGLTSFKGT